MWNRSSGWRLAASVLAACSHSAPLAASRQPLAGVSIAIYENSYSVIDDRRWVDSDGKQLVLEHVDPGAALASLVIEELAGDQLAIGRCERDRVPQATDALGKAQRDARLAHKGTPGPARDVFVPVVRCAVAGAPGKYLVRMLYVSQQLRYTAEHELAVTTPGHARVQSHYTVVTPAWGERAPASPAEAIVTLFEGTPGGEHPPVEIARGAITLDGSTAAIAGPVRDVPAELRRVLRAESLDATAPAMPVWAWLELPKLRLAPGLARVHVELPGEDAGDYEMPVEPPVDDDELRLRLFADATLKGTRQRTSDYSEGAELAERLVLSVANTGTVAREVWLEEKLRPSRRHAIERAWPIKLGAQHELVRTRVVVQPGKSEHVAFTVAYDF